MRHHSAAIVAVATLAVACSLPDVDRGANVPITTIPYRPDGPLMMMAVRVNGAAPAWFTLDSGASHSVLDPRLVDRQNLKRLAHGSTTGTGTGAVDLTRVAPTRFAIGRLDYEIGEP